MNSDNIPNDLTDYEPCSAFSWLAWKIVEKGNTISIVRYFDYCAMIKRFVLMLMLPFLWAGFMGSINHFGFDGKEKNLDEFALIALYVGLPGFFVIMVFLEVFAIKSDRYSWKSPRFVYNRETEEMRIFQLIYDWNCVRPDCDFYEINKNDCRRIILGWTSGSNAADLAYNYESSTLIHKKGAAAGGRGLANWAKGFQFYIILQKNNGEWAKFILAVEGRKKEIQKAIDTLQPWLECEKFERQVDYVVCCKHHIKWVEEGRRNPYPLTLRQQRDAENSS